jgi:hypothetical protein
VSRGLQAIPVLVPQPGSPYPLDHRDTHITVTVEISQTMLTGCRRFLELLIEAARGDGDGAAT